MIYDTSKDIDMQSAITKLDFLIKKGHVIEIKQVRKTKSYSQTKYFHVICSFYGLQVGLTGNQVKEDFVKRDLCIGIFMIVIGDFEVCRSWGNLNTLEATTVIEKLRTHAMTENGIYIPTPEEHVMVQQIEMENQRHGNSEFL